MKYAVFATLGLLMCALIGCTDRPKLLGSGINYVRRPGGPGENPKWAVCWARPPHSDDVAYAFVLPWPTSGALTPLTQTNDANECDGSNEVGVFWCQLSSGGVWVNGTKVEFEHSKAVAIKPNGEIVPIVLSQDELNEIVQQKSEADELNAWKKVEAAFRQDH